MWGKSRHEPPSLTLPKATEFGKVLDLTGEKRETVVGRKLRLPSRGALVLGPPVRPPV
jgi:hypothetical protein